MKRIAICLLSIFFVFFTNVTAQAVNIDLNDFFADPTVTVAPDGSIIVVFLDRRLDPDYLLMDCYMTTSNDGGDTWSPNERITTVSSDPTAGSTLGDYTQVVNPPLIFANRAGLIGEYIGVTASSIDDIHPIWTDTRFGHQDVFVGVADTAGTYIQEYITREINAPTIMLTPNPAHDEVTIRIDLSSQKTLPSEPTLKIYNLAGRFIKEFVYPSSHSSRSWRFVWDGRDEFKKNSPSGVYFLKLTTEDYTATEKLLLIR